MKKYETTKFYLGFPVYIVSTTDLDGNILVATMSSSYTLGNTLVMGMSKRGNTAKNITLDKMIALNYLSDQQGLLSDLAGRTSGKINKQKAAALDVNFTYYQNTPYISDSMVTIIGTVNNIIEDENYLHIFLTINQRLLHGLLLDEQEQLDYPKMNPLLYLGDEKRRVYKKTTEQVVFSGGFLKEHKTKKE